MTHAEFMESVYDSGRTAQGLTRQEQMQALDIIADAIMSGSTTVAHANTLLGIRFSMLNTAERKSEYNDLSSKVAAGVLGRSTSDAKAAAARENGKKGGRPRSSPRE